MTRLAALAGLLPTLLLAAPAGPSPPTTTDLPSPALPPITAAPADSCLALEVEGWTPPLAGVADSLQFALPARIRLAEDTTTVDVPPTPSSALPPGAEGPLLVPDGVLGSVHGDRHWSMGPDGELGLLFRDGGLRVEVALGPEGPDGRREGTARGTRQVEGEAERRSPARTRPVDCDAPVPEEAAFRWEHPASLPLGGGDTLRLGGLPPDGLVAPADEEAPGAAEPPPIIRTPGVADRVLLGPEAFSGHLSGARRVELGLAEDGRILHIDVVFPPEGNERTDLLDRWYDRFGEPTVYYAQLFAWDGRVLRTTFGSEVTGPGWVLRMSVRGDDLPTDAPPAP